MMQGELIVCETGRRWAVALRRSFSRDGAFATDGLPRLYETRSLVDCREAVSEHPKSIVALEVCSSNLEPAARWLAQLMREIPQISVIILGERGLEASQWLFRELGAVHVVFSPRELGPVMRIIRRHQSAFPVVEKSARRSIWNRLPWEEPAAAGRVRHSESG